MGEHLLHELEIVQTGVVERLPDVPQDVVDGDVILRVASEAAYDRSPYNFGVHLRDGDSVDDVDHVELVLPQVIPILLAVRICVGGVKGLQTCLREELSHVTAAQTIPGSKRLT